MYHPNINYKYINIVLNLDLCLVFFYFACIYGRVSTSKQKNDLTRQISTIINYCKNNNIVYSATFKDISSGIDLNRKNFSILMHNILIIKYENKKYLYHL